MKKLTGFFLVLCFAACTNRTGISSDIIPRDSMQKILKDIIMADQYSAQYLQKDTTKKDKLQAKQDLLESVFLVHHTTRAIFEESLNYYESRPDLNKQMFDSLSVYANRRRIELYAPAAPVKPAHPNPQ